MTFLYSGWLFRSVTWTTTVLSILSDTTRPSRTLRDARSCVVSSCVSVIVAFLSGRWAASGPPGGRIRFPLGGRLHVLGRLLSRGPHEARLVGWHGVGCWANLRLRRGPVPGILPAPLTRPLPRLRRVPPMRGGKSLPAG